MKGKKSSTHIWFEDREDAEAAILALDNLNKGKDEVLEPKEFWEGFGNSSKLAHPKHLQKQNVNALTKLKSAHP